MIALRVRNQLRAHARCWLIWAVIVGVTAGIPLAALAGAHRTQTAYDRFLDATEAFDVLVVQRGHQPDEPQPAVRLRGGSPARPEVEAAAVLGYYAACTACGRRPADRRQRPPPRWPSSTGDSAATSTRCRWSRGRMPETATEIALSPLAADNLEAGVGRRA